MLQAIKNIARNPGRKQPKVNVLKLQFYHHADRYFSTWHPFFKVWTNYVIRL